MYTIIYIYSYINALAQEFDLLEGQCFGLWEHRHKAQKQAPGSFSCDSTISCKTIDPNLLRPATYSSLKEHFLSNKPAHSALTANTIVSEFSSKIGEQNPG